MKISKLFHWLYAIIMLLPVFAIGVTCGYAMFNKNAYKSYSASERITDFLPVENELKINKKYYFDTDSITLSSGVNQAIYTYSNSPIWLNNDILVKENKLESFRLHRTNTNYVYVTYLDDNNTAQSYYLGFNSSSQITFEFEVGSNITIDPLYNSFIKEINTNVDNYIDNVFYYSVDKVTESPLFSWAYNSFLAVPIVYITDLFSIPANHIVIELLSYWLAISVVWLCFDLIMYVPLLAHKYIDKAVIE